jgi:hypothetical protein
MVTLQSIGTLVKLRLAPYISSGMNDCAVCDRGSPQTVHMHKILIITFKKKEVKDTFVKILFLDILS